MIKYKEHVINLFTTFRRQYGALASHFSGDDSAQLMLMWIKDIAQAEIPPESISDVVHSVRADPRFLKYPPNVMEFIAHYHYLEREKNKEPSEVNDENSCCYDLLDRLSLRYGAQLLFRNSSQDYFLNELFEIGVDNFDVAACERKIRKDIRFNQFPPNIDQLIIIVKMQASGKEFTPIDSAYEIAVIPNGDCDMLIKEARRRYGGLELRISKPSIAREKFEAIYERVIDDVLSKRINLTPSQPFVKSETEFTEEDKASVVSTIDSILSSINGKN